MRPPVKLICEKCDSFMVTEKWLQIRFLIGTGMFILLFLVMWGSYAGLEARVKGEVRISNEKNEQMVSDATKDMSFHYTLYDAYAREHDPQYVSWFNDYRLKSIK